MTSPTQTTTSAPREVRDAEVSFYHENGWVHLKRFIAPDAAAEMLAVAERLMRGDLEGRGPRNQSGLAWWDTYSFVARDDQREPFRSYAFCHQTGLAAQRLMHRSRLTDVEVPVLYYGDNLTRKAPLGELGGNNAATAYHQDFQSFPFDRHGAMTIWVALNDVPPERGSMRFYSGSHREGPLGRALVGSAGDVVSEYPKLAEAYELSPPLDMKAGDATVHNALVIHGGPPNTTDQPRWAYIVGLIPGDTLYTGAPSPAFDGIGLEPDKPFVHERVVQITP